MPNARVVLLQDFKGMVQELLQEFYRNTKKRPERIIVYRDGVSEGQFDAVVREELPQVSLLCYQQFHQTWPGSVSFVISNKAL